MLEHGGCAVHGARSARSAARRVRPGNKAILPAPSLPAANRPCPVHAEEPTSSRARKQLWPEERSTGLCRCCSH